MEQSDDFDIQDIIGKPGSYGVETVGPFVCPTYFFTIRGYRVPHITGTKVEGKDDRWYVHINRDGWPCFGTEEVDGAEMRRWISFMANAMAVAAGYSSHGEHCRPMNPFMVQMTGISTTEVPDGSELTLPEP